MIELQFRICFLIDTIYQSYLVLKQQLSSSVVLKAEHVNIISMHENSVINETDSHSFHKTKKRFFLFIMHRYSEF